PLRRLRPDAVPGRARGDLADPGRGGEDRRRPRADAVPAPAPRRGPARRRLPRRPAGAQPAPAPRPANPPPPRRGGHTIEELTPPLPGQRADVSLHVLDPG